MRRTSRLSVLVVLGFAVAACSRTPPEPAPPPSATPIGSTAVTSLNPGSPRPSAPAIVGSAAPSTATTGSHAVANCPVDPEGQSNLPTAVVAFPDAPGRPRVDVEIAKTGHDIEKGLMYRRDMPEDHGMLFRLGERREHIFWMRNTCIPLDMLFVDDDGTIVGIVENAEPMTETSRTVGKPSTYVLEVNGGYTQRHGVKAGQKLGLPAAAR
ncbi:hypothetical protein AKJ09_10326 [Labilithrix luteola]|uniref:DUF192 domain-containing protein n=1 Tax=Labilithrix luteola TaxID=1391654 RepID=A0A0K1QD56_9BACT|nr:DUF192 domain-containing protein [Labilithrix luteola]AKV03663.1 hypothetical protein AKJ09_10326 [Labilithrix luteola]